MEIALPDALAGWCSLLPSAPFTVLADCGQAHHLSGVWQLRDRTGETVYLKAATNAGKWEQECHAYERWVQPAFGEFAPRLLAQSKCPRALLVSALPGRCMESFHLSPAQKRKAWYRAGESLHRLHDLETGAWFGSVKRDGAPAGETFPDAAAYLATKIEEWCERGLRAGSLQPDEARFARAVAPDWTNALHGEQPVPCHRDYTPRNWIASESGAWVGAIDFEHARWDARAMDMNRPWTREFLQQPDLSDAFFDGYQGGPPDTRLGAQIQAVRLLGCVGTTVWAAEHADKAYHEEGRAGLQKLRSGV